MKYKIDEMISINNKEWRIAEYRMGRGREYRYTLSHETTDGTYTTIELADGIHLSPWPTFFSSLIPSAVPPIGQTISIIHGTCPLFQSCI